MYIKTADNPNYPMGNWFKYMAQNILDKYYIL
jgi:hypothetical protein